VILGLLSFMMQEDITAGSIKATQAERQAFAAASWVCALVLLDVSSYVR
jgi:hypothetical protein